MPDLIATSDLVSLTKLNSGVGDRKTAPGIADAHIELEKVLGRTGYALVYANAPSFAAQSPNSAAYVTLLTTYIKPFMAWRARERAVWDMYAEPDKAGIYVKEGQDYRAVRSSEMARMEATYASRANEMLSRLQVYLKENESVFTWFATTLEGERRIDTINTNGVSGVSFRRSIKQDPYRG